MPDPGAPDSASLRARAALFPEAAFDFVREGLAFTTGKHHGPLAAGSPPDSASRHVSGQQLCLGLRALAVQKYGLLARTVLRRWGVRRTDDFGIIVYALIDRGELRTSDSDSLADFAAVFDFDEAFGPEHACGLSP